MKLILALSLLLTLLAGPTFAINTSRVVAIVNEQAITASQLDSRVAWEREENNLGYLSDEELKHLQRQVLEWMIDETLMTQMGRTLGLTVSEKDLDAAIADILRQNRLTREQMVSVLESEGTDFAAYRKELEEELLRYKLIRQEIHDKVKVTDDQVQAYFQKHIDDYRVPPTVHLLRIGFKIPREADPDRQGEIRELADTVRKKLMVDKQPLNDVLANLDSSAFWDDMGSLDVDALQPIFQGPIRGLESGEVSVPIAVGDSLQLFVVVGRTPGDTTLSDQARDEIEKTLKAVNTDKRLTEWSRQLREEAFIDIQL